MNAPWPDDSEAPEDTEPVQRQALTGEVVVPYLFEGDHDRRSDHNRYDEETIKAAIRLVVAGFSVREIAEKFGTSRQTIYRWYNGAAKERRGGNPEAVSKARGELALELEVATDQAWKVVRENPGTELALKAIDRIGRNAVARAALLGLNAPIVAQVNVRQVDERETELREMISEAKAKSHGLADQIRSDFEQRQTPPTTPPGGGRP